MTKGIGSWKKEQESQIQKMILTELEKLKTQKTTFKQLLEQCRERKRNLSKVTLTKHLKILMNMQKIEKLFDSEYIRGFYRIRERGLAKLMVESWIHYLGLVAVHHIVRKKLNKPIEFDVFNEIEQHLKLEPEKDSLWSWKALFEYLEKEHRLIV